MVSLCSLTIVTLIIIIRIQINLQPYKRPENNWIELMALIAGTVTMYAGFIFTLEDGPIFGFYQMAIVIVFLINGYFIIHWIFLLLSSVEWKNRNYQRFLTVFGLILLQKRVQKRKADHTKVESLKLSDSATPTRKGPIVVAKSSRNMSHNNPHKKLIK